MSGEPTAPASAGAVSRSVCGLLERERARRRRVREADKSGADFVAEAPDHLVVALLGNAVRGQDQDEVIGNVEAVDLKLHAAGRDVGNDAIARQCAGPDLNSRHAIDRRPLRMAPVGNLRCMHKGRPALRPLAVAAV
jgi:hypothetical protein